MRRRCGPGARPPDGDLRVTAAFQACDLVGGEVAVAALLAVGLTSATAHRYRALLEIAENRAGSDVGNAGYQRDLSISHERLARLSESVDAGDESEIAGQPHDEA